MKLREIHKIPKNPEITFKLSDSILVGAKVIGKSEQREIFTTSFNDSGTVFYIFFNKDNAGLQAYVICEEQNIFNRDVAILRRAWTRDDLKRKGYISGIFKFLKEHLKLSLMSDSEQTPDAQAFWKNIERKFEVKLINVVDGSIYDRQEISDAELYDDTGPTKYRFFLESKIIKKNLSEWKESVLRQYIYFENGDE